MANQIKLNAGQKQKLQKYSVFALMLLVFAGSMWWIFAPSTADKEKEKQEQGLNVDIPDPDAGSLIANKKEAYELQQMDSRKEERMRSLEGYIGLLESKKEETSVVVTSAAEGLNEPIPTDLPLKPTPIDHSVSAYQDINRTLGSFYEEPEEDAEKEEMRMRLEELENRLAEKESTSGMIDEQLALMEKSYELAAKYIPKTENPEGSQDASEGREEVILSVENTKNQTNSSVKAGNKTAVSPIRRLQNQTVSSLAQTETSDESLFYMFGDERNHGFHTMGGEMGVSSKNTLSAVVHDDQTVVDGQSVRLRLTEPLVAGTLMVPGNTILTGAARIQGERMEILISSIEYQGMIIPVEMTTYDSDGQRGIYIPGSLEMNAAKEIAANMSSSVGSSFTMTQSAGAQLTSDLSKGAIQGMSTYMQKKIRQVKVTLKSGYRVMLMPKGN